MTHDARLDPRFSADPFVEPLACCALLVVAVLMQQRGAFVADLGRSVELPCGQLAVALENLLIQRSLEQQVRARSQALEEAHARETRNEEQRRQLLELRVVVADSGPGFPADHSNDTSWELLKSTKATGMGLGLFLAQTAASNHHGHLRIGRSDELGGAEVVIELPLETS